MKMKISKQPAKARSQPETPPPPKVRKILATTDFSDASRDGVRYAISLADKLGSSVALLHVIEPSTWLSNLGSVLPVRDDSEVVASARAQLATLAKRESQGEVVVTCSISVRSGNPFHAITTTALDSAADLIVIATHGHTWAERFLLGSTAERVVRHAPCPVLTVPARTKPRRSGKRPPFKLGKILVPIDFSKLSDAALPWAELLAGRLGAEVVLLHVVEKFSVDYLPAREPASDASVPWMRKSEEDLATTAGRMRQSTGANVSAAIRDGKPFEVICRTAKSLGADLIVLTTHGHTGLNHVLLGSTAERVVRHAPCPVLTVRNYVNEPQNARREQSNA